MNPTPRCLFRCYNRAVRLFNRQQVCLSVVGVGVSLACGPVLTPANHRVDSCVTACVSRAHRQCSEHECARGCEFILDRLLEREGDNVLACVARSARRCGDGVWADCAARVGVHADGGPPAPEPMPEEDD